VALTVTLGAALVAGVAGGTAAAAAARSTAEAGSDEALDLAVSDQPAAAPPTRDSAISEEGPPIAAAWAPEMPPAVGAADAVRGKSRPKAPTVTTHVAAAWVDPNPSARVTSCFGQRWGRMHEGVDLAAPDGTPIVAAGAGIVVRAGVAQGYGNAVLIDHGNGYLTHYGHLSAIAVAVGQHVAAGQPIGNEGSTGHSTGPHLHFEVHEGYYQNPVEPTAWMRAHGVDIAGCS
jgi:murein DD-endopeptidase MepM/ murein hydrolase activator NlpD